MIFPNMDSYALSIYAESCVQNRRNIDQHFKYVFILQWILILTIVTFTSPYSWTGTDKILHPHLYMAIFLGGALTFGPLYLIKKESGSLTTMYTATVCQMFFSIIITHITGGRIESHFHVFGSLTFIASYRSKEALILGTAIILVDHLFRGIYYPMQIFGIVSAAPWRAIEHGAWVLFLDLFLYNAIVTNLKEMKILAFKRAELESSLALIEFEVEKRTSELKETQQQVIEQQQAMVNSSRLSALGEMAAGVAHEINNPLAIINSALIHLRKKMDQKQLTDDVLEMDVGIIQDTVTRISKIVLGMRNISRDSSNEEASLCKVDEVLADVFSVCAERLKKSGIQIDVVDFSSIRQRELFLRRIELSQVLINLLNNAHDAVVELDEKWIKLELELIGGDIKIIVSNSGPVIPDEVRKKMFQPFFTTKEAGKGTGLGLSISKKIMKSHGGDLSLLDNTDFTTFVIDLKGESLDERVNC